MFLLMRRWLTAMKGGKCRAKPPKNRGADVRTIWWLKSRHVLMCSSAVKVWESMNTHWMVLPPGSLKRAAKSCCKKTKQKKHIQYLLTRLKEFLLFWMWQENYGNGRRQAANWDVQSAAMMRKRVSGEGREGETLFPSGGRWHKIMLCLFICLSLSPQRRSQQVSLT